MKIIKQFWLMIFIVLTLGLSVLSFNLVKTGHQEVNDIMLTNVPSFAKIHRLNQDLISIQAIVYSYYLTVDHKKFNHKIIHNKQEIELLLKSLKKISYLSKGITKLEINCHKIMKIVKSFVGVMTKKSIDWDVAREVLEKFSKQSRAGEKLIKHLLNKLNTMFLSEFKQVVVKQELAVFIISLMSLISLLIVLVILSLNSKWRKSQKNTKMLDQFPRNNPNPIFALDSTLKNIYANQAAIEISKKLKIDIATELISILLKSQKFEMKATKKYEFKYHDLTFKCDFLWLEEFNRYHVYLEDITFQKIAKEKLFSLAYKDQLTNLSNISLFHKDYINFSKWARSFALIDIVNFQNTISVMGKHKADNAIIYFSELIQDTFKIEQVKLFRIDNTLFGVLFSHENSAVKLQAIIEELKTPIKINGYDVFLSLCIGSTSINENNNSPDIIIDQAMHALDYARESDTLYFQTYNSDIAKDNLAKVELENNLRQSVENMDFEMYYQPKLCLKTGAVISSEALIRWHCQGEQWISPEIFIPMAESLGLMLPLGEWILKTSCLDAKLWQSQGYDNVGVAINVSALQLINENFYQTVVNALSESQLSADCLELELTENIALHNLSLVKSILASVKKLGIKISLDDFGTGYSSLAYLNKLPLDYLKIDRSFISYLHEHNSDHAVVQAIISLAHSLNISVIAEGVENIEHLKILNNWHCQYIQGYYLAKPMNAKSFLVFLNQHEPELWLAKYN